MKTTKQILIELKAAGFTQSAIAKETEIPQPRLSRWLAGLVPNGADDALRLAALLKEVKRRQCVSDTEIEADVGFSSTPSHSSIVKE